MADLKEAFKIRPADADGNEYMITIGNHLATEEKIQERKRSRKKNQ